MQCGRDFVALWTFMVSHLLALALATSSSTSPVRLSPRLT